MKKSTKTRLIIIAALILITGTITLTVNVFIGSGIILIDLFLLILYNAFTTNSQSADEKETGKLMIIAFLLILAYCILFFAAIFSIINNW